MENEEKDIIRQLADKLRDQELSYRDGAWERFAAHEAKALAKASPPRPQAAFAGSVRSRSLIRPWMGVAAALVLAVGAGWFYLASRHISGPGSTGKPAGQIAATRPYEQAPSDMPKEDGKDVLSEIKGSGGSDALMVTNQFIKQPDETIAAANNTAAGAGLGFSYPYRIGHPEIIRLNSTFGQKDRDAAAAIARNALASISSDEQSTVPGLRVSPAGPVFTYTKDHSDLSSPLKGGGPVTAKVTAGNQAPHKQNSALSATAAANNHSRFDDKGYFGVDDNNRGGKWNMGLMVIPALSNDSKLNMGYGLSVGYKLNNRLSLNSGLAYTELTGSRSADQNATIASGGRTLSSIDASATGLNVPLELRYHVSQKIYIGTGVSAMAVLSDKVERKYAIADMQTSAFEAKNGQALRPDAMQSIASNLQTKEVLPEDQIGAKDFAGFINFTFGFKQPLNKRKSLSIEPFVSVPMSNHLFNQNIKMTDGGIRIKLGL